MHSIPKVYLSKAAREPDDSRELPTCGAPALHHFMTAVVAVAELLLASGSACVALTVALFATVPAGFGLTASVMVATPPLAYAPTLRVTA
jgi:hypothetical protein